MKKIVVWGTGNKAVEFLHYFDFESNEIVAYVDNSREKCGRFFSKEGYISDECDEDNVPIIEPEKLKSINYDLLVVCSVYEAEIIEQYRKMGGNVEQIIKCSDERKIRLLFGPNYELKKMYDELELNARNNKELLWKAVFSDTIVGYEWFEKMGLSLGRAAIGYNFAYVMCRVLNDFKPKTILELGLGQSSKILNSYATYFENIIYEIVEHDESWINFFSLEHNVDNMKIYHQPLVTETRGDVKYHYENMDAVVKGKKYGFVLIDAPYGYGMSKIARADLIPYIPDILEDDFVIMVDDYNRIGEKNMVVALENKLREANVKYYKSIYKGESDALVIVSENWKFLTTL